MRLFLIYTCLFTGLMLSAQNTIPQVLKKMNKQSVPYIKVSELKNKKYVLLDTREANEYKVSHIPNSIFVGFEHFKNQNLPLSVNDKNTPIVVYCSIGVRSEQIGEKLLKLGYKNVYNLYGGIFEYKNLGGKVVNSNNKETDSIHAFNKKWSIYLKKGIKVYEN